MVLPITNLQLFQFLKEKMGEKEAEALVAFVEYKIQETNKEANEQNLKVLATKEDLVNIRIELKTEISSLRTELKTDIANSKAEMIKWMFIFWIGSVSVISAIMFALFSTYIKH